MQPFRWLDDNPRAEDLADLAQHQVLASLIQIDLDNSPHQLRKVIRELTVT